MQSHPWLMPSHPTGQFPFFCSAHPFFVCSEHMQGNFISQALEVFMWKGSKRSKCDTKVCSVGLGIKQRRSCREQLLAPGRAPAWPRLWAQGTGRRMLWRSQFGQSFPTCTEQRLQHHGNKGSLSQDCNFTRSQQQGIHPEYFCKIKRKQSLSKPLHSLSCQRHFINVLQKAHQVIWFEKHHISTFWLSNKLFPPKW